MAIQAPASRSYQDLVTRLVHRWPGAEGLRRAVGGDFVAVGQLEHHLLRSLGLADGQLVVDAGCGCGRLAVQLRSYPRLRYVGADVDNRLLRHARDLAQRPDWAFLCTDGATLPCAAGVADFVCFFSVFTHLSHEHTFRYIADSYRALQPGGMLVFSYLEFCIPCHWNVFAGDLSRSGESLPLNQFISRDAIAAWAGHAGFRVVALHDGDRPHIPIPGEIVWESGTRMSGQGNLGQSVAVLQKPA